MKQYKKTDRIIRNKLEHHSSGAPMHLFEGIANALDAEVEMTPKTNPWRKGWLLGLLFLMVAGSGIWFFSKNKISTSSEDQTLSINASTAAISNKILEKNKTKQSNTSMMSVIEESKVNPSIRFENEQSKTENDIIKIESSDLTKPSAKGDVVFSKNKNTAAIQSEEEVPSSNLLKKVKAQVFEKSKTEDLLIEKGGVNDLAVSPKQNIDLSINNSKKSTITETTIEEKVAPAFSQKRITKPKEEIFFIPQLSSSYSLQEENTPLDIDVESQCGLKPDGSKIKFTTSIDLFFSPDYASQILEYKTEDFRAYAEMRKASEQPHYSFNTGMRINFLTEFGWAARTGIVYTQINETLKTQQRETVITIDVTTGDTIGFTEDLRNVNIRNKYTMIDIPLVIGYEVPMKKFTLNINGGVYLNLKSEQTGAFFSPLEDRVVYFTEGHPDDYDVFKNSVGLSTFLGLGFNFDLGNKYQLIIEPHARYYPKSFMLDDYILNQKYFTSGVMIGLRKDL